VVLFVVSFGVEVKVDSEEKGFTLSVGVSAMELSLMLGFALSKVDTIETVVDGDMELEQMADVMLQAEQSPNSEVESPKDTSAGLALDGYVVVAVSTPCVAVIPRLANAAVASNTPVTEYEEFVIEVLIPTAPGRSKPRD